LSSKAAENVRVQAPVSTRSGIRFSVTFDRPLDALIDVHGALRGHAEPDESGETLPGRYDVQRQQALLMAERVPGSHGSDVLDLPRIRCHVLSRPLDIGIGPAEHHGELPPLRSRHPAGDGRIDERHAPACEGRRVRARARGVARGRVDEELAGTPGVARGGDDRDLLRSAGDHHRARGTSSGGVAATVAP
jgi:hypothetical protein